MAASKTPVMQQHAEAKLAHPDAIVFFRLGDFYEMFGQDAVTCAQVLDLTLTSRNKGKPDEVPMAGVPHHSAHGYIGRLLSLGYKVAICEQMADPKLTKGIVPRAVVRVITPGTVIHDEHQRQVGQLAAEGTEQVEAGRVGPMQVVQQDDDGRAGGQGGEVVAHPAEERHLARCTRACGEVGRGREVIGARGAGQRLGPGAVGRGLAQVVAAPHQRQRALLLRLGERRLGQRDDGRMAGGAETIAQHDVWRVCAARA